MHRGHTVLQHSLAAVLAGKVSTHDTLAGRVSALQHAAVLADMMAPDNTALRAVASPHVVVVAVPVPMNRARSAWYPSRAPARPPLVQRVLQYMV